jgi:hypothetical protein
MPVTMKQVVDALLPEEPEYRAAAERLGPEALPLLRQLVEGDNLELATKAASLAGHLRGPEALAVLHLAAGSAMPSVRVAAAAASRNLSSEQAETILTSLVADTDAGVRKVAISAVSPDAGDQLRAAVARVAAQAGAVPATGAEVQTATREYGEPQYPMVDPLAVPGGTSEEVAGEPGVRAAPPEPPSGEERSYPAGEATEAPPGLDAPPPAPGY